MRLDGYEVESESRFLRCHRCNGGGFRLEPFSAGYILLRCVGCGASYLVGNVKEPLPHESGLER